MATYKLIQDIEAEDHILGPLTLRQFIFALISVFCLYICFLLYTKHVAFMMALFLPPALFFGFFAIPFGRDQPTEVWALAKIRFFIKPRRRLWDQSGVKQLVTITVPKKVERVLTDGLNAYEVQSRLKALANTLDSRGWAVKNANLSAVAGSPYVLGGVKGATDRLISVDDVPDTVPEDQTSLENDVLDEVNGPVARQFDQMINQSSASHRQALIQQMNSAAPTPAPPQAGSSGSSDSQWFMAHVDSPAPAQITATDVAAQTETPDEAAFVAKLKAQQEAQQVYSGNLRTLQPLSAQPKQAVPAPIPANDKVYLPPSSSALTDQPDPAILSLANNNDFTVQTIAHEAKRAKDDEADEKEVVIPLR